MPHRKTVQGHIFRPLSLEKRPKKSIFVSTERSEYVTTFGRKTQAQDLGRIHRAGTPGGPGCRIAPHDRLGQNLLFHSLGTAGGGQNHTGPHHIATAASTVLHPSAPYSRGSRRCARCSTAARPTSSPRYARFSSSMKFTDSANRSKTPCWEPSNTARSRSSGPQPRIPRSRSYGRCSRAARYMYSNHSKSSICNSCSTELSTKIPT